MSPQLFAWLTAFSFACANVTVGHGMRYSTPLTATLHRFSHMDVPPITVGRVQPAISRPSSAGFAALHPPYGWIAAVRPSRRALRALLRMTVFCDATKNFSSS